MEEAKSGIEADDEEVRAPLHDHPRARAGQKSGTEYCGF